MDIEIKFISPERISMKNTGLFIIEICKENDWSFEISDKWKSNIPSDEYQIEITTKKTLFIASITNESYRKTWSINSENDYPKSHLGSDCYYILNVTYLNDENHSINFLLEFSIKFLEKHPNIIVETLEADSSTRMKEYTLKELYDIRENNFQNNWNAVKIK